MKLDEQKVWEINLELVRPRHYAKLKNLTKPTWQEIVLCVVRDLLLPAFCFGVLFSAIWTSFVVMLGAIK
jgi:hypothetical protein